MVEITTAEYIQIIATLLRASCPFAMASFGVLSSSRSIVINPTNPGCFPRGVGIGLSIVLNCPSCEGMVRVLLALTVSLLSVNPKLP
jgi:hypothetical protein